jgi:hypothetical protein
LSKSTIRKQKTKTKTNKQQKNKKLEQHEILVKPEMMPEALGG